MDWLKGFRVLSRKFGISDVILHLTKGFIVKHVDKVSVKFGISLWYT